jgi:hypothetical protein
METGKVEYAPDYKSKSQVKRIAARTGALQAAIIESHQYRELREQKDAVIEAAREYLNASMDGEPLRRIIGAQRRLESALLGLDALLEFEENQKGDR